MYESNQRHTTTTDSIKLSLGKGSSVPDKPVTKPLLVRWRANGVHPANLADAAGGTISPEYRAIREKTNSFLDLCFNPKLAAEVTLQPIRRFGFDVAILFPIFWSCRMLSVSM